MLKYGTRFGSQKLSPLVVTFWTRKDRKQYTKPVTPARAKCCSHSFSGKGRGLMQIRLKV